MSTADKPGGLDLAAARTFMVVAETGSISAAARRLGLAKSVVSNRVTALERSLGASLFARGGRLTLTRRGHGFYDGMRTVLTDLDEVVHAAAAPEGELGGSLRISAPAGLGIAVLDRLICRFLSTHPSVSAELDLSDRYADVAGEGFDVAFRIGQPADSELVGRRLCRIRRIACASPGYLAAYGAPMNLDDLSRHRTVEYTLVQGSGQWVFEVGDGRRRTPRPPPPAFMANSGEAMREAARAGLGMALLPSFFVADDLRERRLVAVNLGLEPLSLELWSLQARRRESRPLVAALVADMASQLGDPPFWERGLVEDGASEQ